MEQAKLRDDGGGTDGSSSGDDEHEMARANGRRDFEAWIDTHPEWPAGTPFPAYSYHEAIDNMGKRTEASAEDWTSSEKNFDDPDGPVLPRSLEPPSEEQATASAPSTPPPRPRNRDSMFILSPAERHAKLQKEKRALSQPSSQERKSLQNTKLLQNTIAKATAARQRPANNNPTPSVTRTDDSTSSPPPPPPRAPTFETSYHRILATNHAKYMLSPMAHENDMQPNVSWAWVFKSQASGLYDDCRNVRMLGSIEEALNAIEISGDQSWDDITLQNADIKGQVADARAKLEGWVEGNLIGLAIAVTDCEVRVFAQVAEAPKTPSPKKRKARSEA